MNNIINRDGLFNGDRFERVSDSARFAWPYLWLASNSMGRLELNFHRVVGLAFGRFKRVPTEEAFWAWIKEFQDAFLLFVYEANGNRWGQWDCSEQFLPKHKLFSDRQSPAPDHAAFAAWKQQYAIQKQARNSTKPIAVNAFIKTFETIQQDFSENSKGFDRRVGVGVGVGVGIGEKICASPEGNARRELGSKHPPEQTDSPPTDIATGPKITAQQDRWFGEWWSKYWLRKAKKAARDAFRKHVRTEQRFQQVMAALQVQEPDMLSREASKRPYGATWLNGERWEDEAGTPASSPSPYSPYSRAEDDE